MSQRAGAEPSKAGTMQITEERSEGLRREYTIVVPRADLEERLAAELAELARTSRVPGFRPGKLPVNVARQRWGRQLHPQIVNDAIEAALGDMMNERELAPADTPTVEVVADGVEADLECKVVLDVLPEIPAIDFASIELDKPVASIEENDIEEALDNIAKSKTSYVAVEDRAAKDGDQLALEIVAGSSADPSEEARSITVVLGKDDQIQPEIAKQLLGVRAGETRLLQMSPGAGEDSADREDADEGPGGGETVETLVREVREPVVPAIDDALAAAVECEDLAELRRRVREQLAQAYAEMTEQALKKELLDSLDEVVEFELPQSLVDKEFDPMWAQIMQARENGALDEEDREKPEEDLRAYYLKMARRRVALGLLMTHTASEAAIVVNDQELDRRIGAMPPQLRAIAAENPGRRDALRLAILEEKVTAYMLEKVSTTERSIPGAELRELVGA